LIHRFQKYSEKFIGDFKTFPALASSVARHPPRMRKQEELTMPRYMVERAFADGLNIPVNDDGAGICLGVVGRNAEDAVTWVHSYVTADRKKTFCIYDAPSPEAIRKVAGKNALPVNTITEVRVLDPYFYH
jgi:hypothetical protein